MDPFEDVGTYAGNAREVKAVQLQYVREPNVGKYAGKQRCQHMETRGREPNDDPRLCDM